MANIKITNKFDGEIRYALNNHANFESILDKKSTNISNGPGEFSYIFFHGGNRTQDLPISICINQDGSDNGVSLKIETTSELCRHWKLYDITPGKDLSIFVKQP